MTEPHDGAMRKMVKTMPRVWSQSGTGEYTRWCAPVQRYPKISDQKARMESRWLKSGTPSALGMK